MKRHNTTFFWMNKSALRPVFATYDLRVVRYHATKVWIIPNCVVLCHVTWRNSKIMLQNECSCLRPVLTTENIIFMPCCVIRHHATKVRINPSCAAWCHMTWHDPKGMLCVDRPLVSRAWRCQPETRCVRFFKKKSWHTAGVNIMMNIFRNFCPLWHT
jgi:hypothetical protein